MDRTDKQRERLVEKLRRELGPDILEALSETAAGALGQNLGAVSTEYVRRGMDIRPTIEIRPGYRFTVIVSKDLEFAGAYGG